MPAGVADSTGVSCFLWNPAGARSRHAVHSWDEHGISWRRYNSRTIFCTLPDFKVRRYVLLLRVVLGVVDAYERLRDVILVI